MENESAMQCNDTPIKTPKHWGSQSFQSVSTCPRSEGPWAWASEGGQAGEEEGEAKSRAVGTPIPGAASYSHPLRATALLSRLCK